jgi:hypothetical protein
VGFSVPVSSKCTNLYISIKGAIVGQQNEAFRINVLVVPDPNSALHPEFPIKDSHFEGAVLFDTFESYNPRKGHKCTRVPERVRVVLLKETSEIDSTWLDVSKDFVRDKSGDYEVRSPVELHSK